jgi:hypothetical protein
MRKNHRHLTNLDEANPSPCAVNGGFRFLKHREAAMRLEYGASAYRTSWISNPVGTLDRADFTAVCWFVGLGLSLTALFCALGYGESIGQALAFS